MRYVTVLVLVLAAGGAAVQAEVVIEQWGAGDRCAHKKALKIAPVGKDEPTTSWTVRIDLTALPAGTKIHRASLLAERTVIDGRDDAALVGVEIYPGRRRAGKPLKLEGPWFASFEMTEMVRKWAARPGKDHSLFVKAFPGWVPEQTRLEIMFEGKAPSGAAQVKGVKAGHRAGQTFITWREIEDLLGNDPPTWGKIQSLQKQMDATSRVRYLVFRHTAPITGKTIAGARLLGRVKPLSAYNTRGRSVEELIAMIRRRAMDDIALSRKLARKGLRYSPNSPEMAEVIIKRLAVADGKPLARDAGLYVHSPAKAGKAYYAVVASSNGTANLGAAAAAGPVRESVGPGEPVLQEPADVTVFYDYPGKRRQYVQWTGPPLSNLPNQYYNWSMYLPASPPTPTPVRIAFTSGKFIKPGVRHRTDTILVSGQDRPIWSAWYGYHESLGTLKSFKQGIVRPYTERRLFAFTDWVVKKFNGDPKRISCIGGTDALYYGVRHGERFAYVLTHAPDPNPKVTPKLVRVNNYRRYPPRPQREAVWGKVEWKIPGESGKPVWDEFDLIEYVKNPKRQVAFLSMGPAMLSAPWANQVKFMKQLWASKYGFCAQFFWGGGSPVAVPDGRVGQKGTWDFALDVPYLALRNNSNDMGLDSRQFKTLTPAYGSGGRIAAGRRWLVDCVDEPDRFEITIHGGGRVVYAGGGTSDATPRRTRKFKPRPGEKFRWENVPIGKSRYKPQSGEVVADESGLVTLPQVNFKGPSRLKIHKVK